MQLDAATGMLIVGAMVVWKIVSWSVDRFLKNTAGTQHLTVAEFKIFVDDFNKKSFVTIDDCKACRASCVGRNDSELTELRKEVKDLRRVIVKYLLLKTMPEDTAAREELEKMLNA